jgi:tetratricopeptide (TPR) repeat protein
MNLEECYRLLELKSGATLSEIKASYRRLARQCHPDVNRGDLEAHEKFIALTEGYQTLLRMLSQKNKSDCSGESTSTAQSAQPSIKVTNSKATSSNIPQLSLLEEQLKWNSYQKLQKLWKHKRFVPAISLAESLAQRLPQDPQSRTWLASTYQRHARQLIDKKQAESARIYLKKALKTDPHNRSLWSEVERDFRRLEKIF